MVVERPGREVGRILMPKSSGWLEIVVKIMVELQQSLLPKHLPSQGHGRCPIVGTAKISAVVFLAP